MLHVILCDDDSKILENYQTMLEQIANKHQLDLSFRCFGSAEAMLFALEDNNHADIVYLDVQMDGLNGIEAAKKLRAMGSQAQIIFLTNSREYVFDSFDAAPLQYLLKGGFTDEKFEQVFLKAVQLSSQNVGELFECMRGAERITIPIRQIAYFEVAKRIITVHYKGGKFDFYSSMDELENRLLKKGFVRTHRSFLVNLARIRRLGQDDLELTCGDHVPLGRTHVKQVKQVFSQFLSNGGMIRQGMKK